MDHIKEVLVVSHSGTQDSNCTMHNLPDGALLETYKEGNSVMKGLDFIGYDFLISAFEDKPKIKIWRIGHATNEFHKINVPGTVNALAVSKCGRYCIAGIGASAFVWEVASGNLDSVLQFHMHDITCVKFSSDGSHFITAGKDGVIFVFLLSEAVKKQVSSDIQPEFAWAGHEGEITDLYMGYMGIYSRVATASRDKTCRIFEIDTGNLLCTIHMNESLTSVTMDICEYFVFLGTDSGNIYKIDLFNSPFPDLQFEDVAEKNVFVGHKKQITSLCVSRCGNYLVSGSKDSKCMIWDIQNYSCVRQLTFSGPVTNVLTTRTPPGIKNENYIPKLCVQSFKKELNAENDDPLLYLHSQKSSVFHLGAPDQFFDSKIVKCTGDNVKKIMKNDLSVAELSRLNNSMYGFAMGDIFATTPAAAMENDDSD